MTVSYPNLNVNVKQADYTSTLPTGASTSDNQLSGLASLVSIDAKLANPIQVLGPITNTQLRASPLSVAGTFFQATQPVSVAALPIPSGAATEASLQSILAKLPQISGSVAWGNVTTTSVTRVPVLNSTYNEPTTNAQRSIVSNNTFDGPFFGTGTIKITYLTATGTGPFVENIVPNGVTPVNTVNTNICYIEKIEIIGPSTLVNGIFGTVTLFTGINGTGTPIATISSTDVGRTAWAHHYVPVGKTCNIVAASVSSTANAAAQGALFTLNSKAISGTNIFEPQIDEFMTLEGTSTSTNYRPYQFPIQVVGPARITCYVTPAGTSNNIQRAAFDYVDL